MRPTLRRSVAKGSSVEEESGREVAGSTANSRRSGEEPRAILLDGVGPAPVLIHAQQSTVGNGLIDLSMVAGSGGNGSRVPDGARVFLESELRKQGVDIGVFYPDSPDALRAFVGQGIASRIDVWAKEDLPTALVTHARDGSRQNWSAEFKKWAISEEV